MAVNSYVRPTLSALSETAISLQLVWAAARSTRKTLAEMKPPTVTVESVTMIRCDYYLTAGMHKASSAALLWADLTRKFVPSWANQPERRGGIGQPSCFRLSRHEPSARSVGVCPDRKLGPEDKQSHISLTCGVCAAGNVA